MIADEHTIVIVSTCSSAHCGMAGWDWLWTALICLGISLVLSIIGALLD